LKRWVNYHLAKQNYPKRIKNFGADVKDAKVYTVLLKSIDPKGKCNLDPLDWDNNKRAAQVIDSANGVGAKPFIKAKDILDGNDRLNLAFTAQLFNACPGLEELQDDEKKELAGLMDDDAGDSREERAFRMWINTLGLGDLYINNLFEDCRDGLTLLKVIDKIEPGTVNWKKVDMKPNNKFKKVNNCNYAVVLGKSLGLSVVNIGGPDIVAANKKLLLGFTWQLMRFHMLKFLASLSKQGKGITDKDILVWANQQAAGGKHKKKLNSFNDPAVTDGLFFIDILAAIDQEVVNWELVTNGQTDDEKLLNAKYAISVARKLGAVIFLLPEDVVEARSKMCLTFAAAIMAVSFRVAK